MPPRRRRRGSNVGLGRMDAAVDGVSPMGFTPEQIRSKVKDLLEVYGGDEGWVFIEEASYKLLIESLLEEDQQEEPQPLQLEGGLQGETGVQEAVEEADASAVEISSITVTNETVPIDQDALMGSPTTVLQLPAIVPQRRRPCYGWLGPADENDFVLLKPCRVEGQEERKRRKKFRSRWDEKPIDS